MNAVVPILGTLYAASGNVTTASVQSGGMLLLVTLCQNIFSAVLLPCAGVCLSLGIIGAVFGETGLSGVTAAVKSAVTWLTLSVMTLFSFFLGLQNTVAQSADNFGIRSLKFAVGSLVPIIGGAVSDSLGTIGGSLGVLKSACGSIAIVIIVAIVAPGIICVLAQRLFLFALKSAAGILGCEREERLDVLEARIKELGMDPEQYKYYLDLRRYGGCKHAGFGLGFERLVMYLTGVDNIRDVLPHPRTVGNADF